MSWAVTNGIATSITTSPDTMIGVAMAAFRYSRLKHVEKLELLGVVKARERLSAKLGAALLLEACLLKAGIGEPDRELAAVLRVALALDETAGLHLVEHLRE